ncbi:MAG TPA: KH domain-containing protein [Candidatus Paceibacterota bacterium]
MANGKDTDHEFLDYVVKALVDHPEAVKTERTVDEMGVLLRLTVHPDDMRKIIGREGKTANAMRILLRVVGMKNNARVNLKINEPEGSTRLERPDRKAKDFDQAIDDLKL